MCVGPPGTTLTTLVSRSGDRGRAWPSGRDPVEEGRGQDISEIAPVDAVVDVVGGDEFGAMVDRLRNGGRLVTAGAIAGPVVPFDIRRLYLSHRRIIGSTMHTRDDFADLAAIAVAGGVEPVVAETYPLTEIAEAQRRFTAKDFVGKLVFEP